MCDWLCGGAFESAAHAEELQISQDEAERKVQKPGLSPAAAEDLLQFHFGDDAQIDRELDSYDDQNFLALVNGERCVFKVLNGVESFNEPLIEAQSALLRHLAGGGIRAPIEYAPVVWVRVGRRRYALRLLKWVAGAPLCTLDVTPALLRRSGAFLGRVRATLDGFDAAALHRCHAWDPRRSLSLEPFASRLRAEGCDAERAGDVRRALQSFRTAVEPMSHGLGMALLHGDYNDANVLVPENGDDWGILDIGDAVYSWRVGDVAIGLAYCLVTLCSKGCDAVRFPSRILPLEAAV
ncbi:kinase-like domain-containing protein [Pelagophyceae sp. CCMP2097]|nr:kinase-like domain-containing protein [Pelagophyceae sp. CCMP2097]